MYDMQVESIVLSIISMLSGPNDESPANVEAAKEWRDNRAEFRKKVSRCVRRSQEMLWTSLQRFFRVVEISILIFLWESLSRTNHLQAAARWIWLCKSFSFFFLFGFCSLRFGLEYWCGIKSAPYFRIILLHSLMDSFDLAF